MSKNVIKKIFINSILFLVSIFITFLLLNFILVKISSQNIFPRPLAASLPNTLLTFYPDTYKTKNLKNYTAVLGNSVAQGNGDAYLEGKRDYSITHHLHKSEKKNYLIFGRAGHHSIASVSNLIKVNKLSNKSFAIKDLNKPNSIIFYFYEGIDLIWNYDSYINRSKENESIEEYTSRIIKDGSNPTFKENFYNFFPVLPFLGVFLGDFKTLIVEIYHNKNLLDSLSSISDRIKKILGFNIVLADRDQNLLTWTNSLKDHKGVKDIRPIQGASETLSKEEIIIGLQIFYEALREAKIWSKTEDVSIIFIPAPITVYDWNEPIVFERQPLNPKTINEIKTISNYENKLKNIFIRQEIKKFSKKNNIVFFDPTDVLIEQGKSKVLHGPLDWGHLNDEGYKVVFDFIKKKNN